LAPDGFDDADDVFDDVENVLDESQELQNVLENGNGFGDEAGHGRSDGFDDGEHGGHAGGSSRWADFRWWKSCKKEEEKERAGGRWEIFIP
jgi:hypothetical protein